MNLQLVSCQYLGLRIELGTWGVTPERIARSVMRDSLSVQASGIPAIEAQRVFTGLLRSRSFFQGSWKVHNARMQIMRRFSISPLGMSVYFWESHMSTAFI